MDNSLDHMDFWEAHAALAWQVELGVSEPIAEAPVNRYEAAQKAQAPAKSAEAAPTKEPRRPQVHAAPEVNAVEEAGLAAQSASSLETLREAMAGFEHCALKKGARNLVFSDGNPKARLMVVGEAPDRDEDIGGRPFVGRTGALFDAMFCAIGLSRDAPDAEAALYISNTLPWRPPENRDPSPAEIAMMKPFLLKHIELADPDILVVMGNLACSSLLGQTGITRLRGRWQEVMGIPAMPMTHPAFLLRTPLAKRDAWADLLNIKARLASAD